MWYPVVFLVSMGVDLIPIAAPPAWTLMVFFLVKFDLNPWLVLVCGVAGSTLGRYFFSLYIPKVSNRFINKRKNEELEFVGKKLGGSLWKTWVFVLIYTVTPLSTTALFTAAAMGRVNPLHTVPPFFIGKFLSDALMVATGRYLAGNATDLVHGALNWKTIVAAGLGLVVIGGLLFIDWFALFCRKKLTLKFKIWK
jgi:membrane protein YqaA with SNARE-associated domain